jgi:hypothetical protein
VKNSKNSGLSWVCHCFWDRERAEEEEISDRPGGASSHQVGAARAGSRPLCGRWRGSPSWCLPGVSLSHFLHKKFIKNFLEFFEKLYFRGFFRNWHIDKTQKNKDENDFKQIKTKHAAALRYS